MSFWLNVSNDVNTTTNLLFGPDAGRWLEIYASLSGTIRNCAGGHTPEGTWISCQENLTIPGPGNTATKLHGYSFEVPADGLDLEEGFPPPEQIMDFRADPS